MRPNAQNKRLQIMALKVLHGIASDIDESGYYNIMVDESTDASNFEQLVICVCWLNMEMIVWKKYIGLMPVTQTNPDTIVFASKMCCCVWISELKMLMGSAMKDVQPWLEPKMQLLH